MLFAAALSMLSSLIGQDRQSRSKKKQRTRKRSTTPHGGWQQAKRDDNRSLASASSCLKRAYRPSISLTDEVFGASDEMASPAADLWLRGDARRRRCSPGSCELACLYAMLDHQLRYHHQPVLEIEVTSCKHWQRYAGHASCRPFRSVDGPLAARLKRARSPSSSSSTP